MAIFDTNSKIRKWRYSVADIQLLIPGEENVPIPTERMGNMSIVEDYETLYFPMFKIELILESDIYYKILEHKTDCQIHLRIDRFYQGIDNPEKSVPRKYINDNFDLILDEDTDDMQFSLKREENKTDYTKTKKDDLNVLEKIDTPVSFYLFKSSTIDGTKKNINKVIPECNLVDVYAWMATTGKIKNILMAQPDNNKIYDQIVIPRMSILKAFEFLDVYYGLYKTGSMIYFGLRYNYIIPYSGDCKAYIDGETTDINIVIPKGDNLAHASNLGELYTKDDDLKHYIIGDFKTIDIRNDSISSNYLMGNDIETVDSYSGEITTESANSKVKSSSVIKAFENKTENNMISSTYTAHTGARSKVINVMIQDYNIMDIAPNKQYTFLFEDTKLLKKHKGKYILCNATHSFVKEGTDFILSTILTFKLSNKK